MLEHDVTTGAVGLPLEGLSIIDLSTYVAGPSATMTLARLGAEVIRIDPIGGSGDARRAPMTADRTSLYWTELNRTKLSVEVDLRRPEGRDIVQQLIELPRPGAGIVVTNGIGQDWLSYEKLRARRADLIMAHIVGHRDGRTAVDYTVNCEVGLPWLTGPPDNGRPVNHVLPAWDLLTGMHAAVGILAAERFRARTGRGQRFTVALADVAVATMAHLGFVADVVVNGARRQRDGNFLYGGFGCDFTTADEATIMVVALTTRQWRRLVDVTARGEVVAAFERSCPADLDNEEERYRHRDILAGFLRPWFRRHKIDQIAEALDSVGVPWGRYRTVAEMVEDPGSLMGESDLMVEVDHPGHGPVPVPRSVVRLSACGERPPTTTPRLGGDTDAVLHRLLGTSAAALADLRGRRIIGGS